MQKENEFSEMFSMLKASVPALRNSLPEERIKKLKRLKHAVEKHEAEICDAVYADFGKAPAETKLTEIYPVISEIKTAIRNLRKWMKPKKVPAPITFFGSRNFVRYESKGIVLIISPWNYPFQLAVGPLVSAIAAGNATVVKPSEISSNVAEFLSGFIADIFDKNEITVVNGGAKTTQKLLDLSFDHIYFTGSQAVGKIIMEKASQNLSSVTLELGGKSPAIVDKNFDLKKATEKIIWGKLINAGQTCIAPDYVLVHKSREKEFAKNARAVIEKNYGDSDSIKNNPDYCKIINEAHYNRLKFLFDDAIANGAEVLLGGKFADNRFISPTILRNVGFESNIMKEEIFGPILPLLTYESDEEIIEIVSKNPNPLALYVFSNNKNFINKMLNSIQSGGAAVNDTVVHFANYNLPFGGVKTSGTGNAHGFFGFKTFSHERSVMKQSGFSPLKFMYPPYTERTKKLIDLTSKYF